MITYEWKCKNCEEVKEVERDIADSKIPPEGDCPHCMKDAGWDKMLNYSIIRYKFADD